MDELQSTALDAPIKIRIEYTTLRLHNKSHTKNLSIPHISERVYAWSVDVMDELQGVYVLLGSGRAVRREDALIDARHLIAEKLGPDALQKAGEDLIIRDSHLGFVLTNDGRRTHIWIETDQARQIVANSGIDMEDGEAGYVGTFIFTLEESRNILDAFNSISEAMTKSKVKEEAND